MFFSSCIYYIFSPLKSHWGPFVCRFVALHYLVFHKYKLIRSVCWPKQWHVDDLFRFAAADAEADSDDDVNNGVVALTCVAAADMNGQGSCRAERGRPAVNHQDGQEVHILLVAVKAWPLGPDASCVVWVGGGSVSVGGGQRDKVKQRITHE